MKREELFILVHQNKNKNTLIPPHSKFRNKELEIEIEKKKEN